MEAHSSASQTNLTCQRRTPLSSAVSPSGPRCSLRQQWGSDFPGRNRRLFFVERYRMSRASLPPFQPPTEHPHSPQVACRRLSEQESPLWRESGRSLQSRHWVAFFQYQHWSRRTRDHTRRLWWDGRSLTCPSRFHQNPPRQTLPCTPSPSPEFFQLKPHSIS